MSVNKWQSGQDSFGYAAWTGHAPLGVNLNRQQNAPLDISCEFKSVKDMLYYVTEGRYPASGTDVTQQVKDMKKYPYLGQVIALVGVDPEAVSLYYIKTAASPSFTDTTDTAVFEHYFEEVGRATIGDDKTIHLNSETGVLSMKNYGVAYYKWIETQGSTAGHYEKQVVDATHPWIAGLEPRVASENSELVLAWYQPNPETISGLQSAVATLQSQMSTVQGNASTAGSVAEAKKAGDDAQDDIDTHILDETNPHSVTASQVGLGNVTNDAQVKRSEMGAASGVATLDTNGKIPTSQLPSYVDDVLEYATIANFPTTGEAGKIYVALDTNKTYRWGGTEYIEISASIALGETTGTAYEGSKGAALATRLSTAESDIDTLEAASHTHSNKTEIDKIVSGDKAKWDAYDTSKANKVSSATNGNFAGLNANGDLTDSGKKATDFATAAQGGKADSAIQGVQVNGTDLTADTNKKVNVTVATGSANGHIAVNGTDVKVKGIAAMAYKGSVEESDLATALANKLNGKADSATTLAGYGIGDAYTKTEVDTAVSGVKSEVIGTAEDPSTASTIYGAKAYADAAMDATVDTIVNGASTGYDNLADVETLIKAQAADIVALQALTPAEAGAQVNKIETIKVNGTALTITSKSVDIPLATANALGLVKADETSLQIDANHVISVKAISTDLLTQGTDELVFNGGNASLS